MEMLAAAVKGAGGTRSAKESAAALSEAIGAAYEANVNIKAPQMVKAAGLLAAFEAAEAQAGEAAKAAAASDGGLSSKLDSLFDGGYALPDYEVDEY